MPASPASASSDDGAVLVGVPNWVGDGVMAMPALQAFRRRNPRACIVVLVKPAMRPLWAMHEAADAIVEMHAGLRPAVNAVRAADCGRAVILPNSFRSALIPCLAGVPDRRGMAGHWRRWLLTDVVRPPSEPERAHQVYEYLDLLAPGTPAGGFEPPRLNVPEPAAMKARGFVASLASPRIALLPGAARGPSKQWPAEHFMALGRQLAGNPGASLIVLGGAREADLCARVSKGIGPAAICPPTPTPWPTTQIRRGPTSIARAPATSRRTTARSTAPTTRARAGPRSSSPTRGSRSATSPSTG